ncbi:hypothetical protein [Dokdonia sp.]|uniref:HD domain-containing protein n=1 Tax=Dokdonia sp. TaxID=2024995 RepID=UPI003264D00B
MENKHIYQDWLTLSQLADNAITIACFNEVEKRYTQEDRYYHTLIHIKDLFDHIKRASVSKLEKQLLAHVALFHDVIYNSRTTDNEFQSAEFATPWLKQLGLEKTHQEIIYKIILATSNHISSNPLTQLFLDMDLSILGASPKKYKEYSDVIRKEHLQIPLLLYKQGRKRFLKQMLQRTHIFQTRAYQTSYDVQARINIQEELKTL